MLKFFGFLFIVALGLGIWAYCTDRIQLTHRDEQGKSHFEIVFDKEAIAKDVANAKDAVSRKIDDLKSRNKDAKVDVEKALEQKQKAFEAAMKEYLNATDETRAAAKAKFEQAKKELDDAIEKVGSKSSAPGSH